MIGWLIIACEVGFWLFVLAGLIARYVFKRKKLSVFLLICTPVVDLILLTATVIDLRNGAVATNVHGIAAIYLGISVVYGHRMIKWADQQFAYLFAGGQKRVKQKLVGYAHAKKEREGWFLHLFSWLIGGAVIVAITLCIQNASQTEALIRTLQMWTLVLVIDFLISFSYTLFPRKTRIKV